MTVQRTNRTIESVEPIKHVKIGIGAYEDQTAAARVRKKPVKQDSQNNNQAACGRADECYFFSDTTKIEPIEESI